MDDPSTAVPLRATPRRFEHGDALVTDNGDGYVTFGASCVERGITVVSGDMPDTEAQYGENSIYISTDTFIGGLSMRKDTAYSVMIALREALEPEVKIND